MAKPNYSFEKRQRELAKKRKKEDKAQRKTSGPGQPDNAPEESAAPDGTGAAPGPVDPASR